MPSVLARTSPAQVLARAEWAVLDRRAAQLDELDLVLAWADLHGEEPAVEAPGGDALVAVGGDGSPLVRDLCLDELAIARGEHVLSTRSVMADALDLRHRLPVLFGQLRALRVEMWVARKVAVLSRALSRDAVGLVDRAVAHAVGQAPSRLLAIAEAKVIEADTAIRSGEIHEARRAKGVWVTGTHQEGEGAGLRGVFARVEAADAVWVDATVQRVADLLAADAELRATHHPELGPAPTVDELRAAAFGWLARPYDLADLLGLLDEAEGDADRPSRRRPQAVVFVHLHEAALAGLDAVARAERLGPLLREQVVGYLRHANVVVRPVIDLARATSVNGYEHPEAVKLRTRLRTVGDVFPHAAGIDIRLDHDYVTPYDPGGPPGQTGDHNDAPLSRHAHRVKTHGGYRVAQLGPGSYLWSTPHGLNRLVNHLGTHRITEDDAAFLRIVHGL